VQDPCAPAGTPKHEIAALSACCPSQTCHRNVCERRFADEPAPANRARRQDAGTEKHEIAALTTTGYSCTTLHTSASQRCDSDTDVFQRSNDSREISNVSQRSNGSDTNVFQRSNGSDANVFQRSNGSREISQGNLLHFDKLMPFLSGDRCAASLSQEPSHSRSQNIPACTSIHRESSTDCAPHKDRSLSHERSNSQCHNVVACTSIHQESSKDCASFLLGDICTAKTSKGHSNSQHQYMAAGTPKSQHEYMAAGTPKSQHEYMAAGTSTHTQSLASTDCASLHIDRGLTQERSNTQRNCAPLSPTHCVLQSTHCVLQPHCNGGDRRSNSEHQYMSAGASNSEHRYVAAGTGTHTELRKDLSSHSTCLHEYMPAGASTQTVLNKDPSSHSTSLHEYMPARQCVYSARSANLFVNACIKSSSQPKPEEFTERCNQASSHIHGSHETNHGSHAPNHGSHAPNHGSHAPNHGSHAPNHGSHAPNHGSHNKHGHHGPSYTQKSVAHSDRDMYSHNNHGHNGANHGQNGASYTQKFVAARNDTGVYLRQAANRPAPRELLQSSKSASVHSDGDTHSPREVSNRPAHREVLKCSEMTLGNVNVRVRGAWTGNIKGNVSMRALPDGPARYVDSCMYVRMYVCI
jgi:hypothetical protein